MRHAAALSVLLVCTAGVASARLLEGVANYSLVSPTSQEHKLNAIHSTSHPIICALTLPNDMAPPGFSYLSAGYVKWIESAGARVVPVPYDLDEAGVVRRFRVCNGVLFPGGNYPLTTDTQWFRTAERLLQLAVHANEAGQVFPVLGTCLGLQLLVTLIIRDQYALVPLDAHNHPAPIAWASDVMSDSRFVPGLPESVRLALASQPIAMHNHHYGLVDDSFERYPELRRTFRVLAHTRDKQGQLYVSMLEGRDLPLLGLAFHPEKVPYEWTDEIDIPHSRAAMDAAYHLAAAYVDLARMNSHRPVNVVEEDELLIYNWSPEFTGKHRTEDDGSAFEQVYLFKDRAFNTGASRETAKA